MGALGLSLALLAAGAWGTGFLYLASRLGTGTPVRLALVDGVHVYVGLATVAFFLVKLWRVGFRSRVPGVSNLLLWQRWISWSLLVLYGAIYITGLVALFPLPQRWLSYAVNAHLLSSVWAVVPTTWHVWHYRKRAVPYLLRWKPRQPACRYWQALALLCIPIVGLVAAPRALSPLALSGSGRPLVAAGLGGIFLDRLLPTSDGRLLAGGDGLYLTSGDGAWRRIELPSGGDPEVDRRIELGIKPDAGQAAVSAPPTGHSGHQAPPTAGTILSLATNRAHSAYYVGTTDSLYYSPWAEGPYLALPFPGGQVRDVAVDPTNPYVVWASAGGGTYLSLDGGHSWALLTAGLSRPASAWALAFHAGRLYSSDTVGVYRWEPETASWSRNSSQPWVTSLTSGGGRLYAASQVSGARSFNGSAWKELDLGTDGHSHGGLAENHLIRLVPAFGHSYPVGAGGAMAGAADAAPFGSDVWSVGAAGASRMAVDATPPADIAWWAGLILSTVVVTFFAIRMIRPAAKPVSEEDQLIPLTFQEETNVAFQATGRDHRGRLRSTGLRRSEHHHI